MRLCRIYFQSSSFNPCFNGTMYKNIASFAKFLIVQQVSILVLMDLCIKTFSLLQALLLDHLVSILVLMELCIKTGLLRDSALMIHPVSILVLMELCIKTWLFGVSLLIREKVSILVLMELCIKTLFRVIFPQFYVCFNPCFNGTMYKN